MPHDLFSASMSSEEKPEKTGRLASKKAKRDHLIVQNDFRADIKKGESLNGIPDRFYETLKAEKVI